jgi:hypothetical protein
MAGRPLYDKLDQSRQEIRLLTLEPGARGQGIVCNLSPVSLLDHGISYEALSYCWGNPNDRREISISGTVMRVTTNLYAALQYLRRPSEPRILWVDAVCINQDDWDERTEQVLLMRTIYTTCSNVLVWLGEPTLESSRALAGLGELELFFDDIFLPGGVTEKEIEKLLSRPWFDRVWVVQELALPKKGAFICGDATLDLGELEKSLIRAEKVIAGNGMRGKAPEYFYKICRHMRTRRVAQMLAKDGRGPGCPLYDVLYRHSDAQATDPRDNVFAFHGLAESLGGFNLAVSYQLSAQQVYANLVKRWISRYLQLDIITVYLERQERRLDLPSWVPDWSGRSTNDPLNPNPPSPYDRDWGFAAWTGRVQRPGHILATSWTVAGHQNWCVDISEGADDELSVVKDPYYSKYLTLDGSIVDKIPDTFRDMPEVDGVLDILADPLFGDEFEKPEMSDSDEGPSILDVWDRKRSFKNYIDTIGKPWTHIFSAMEPPDLDDSPYVTGETRFHAFIETLYAGRSDIKLELEYFKQQYEAHMYKDAKLNPDSERNLNLGPGLENRLMELFRKRRFTVTTNGLFALVPKQARPGDTIAVLVGGMVPFVLRKVEGPGSEVQADDSEATDTQSMPEPRFWNQLRFCNPFRFWNQRLPDSRSEDDSKRETGQDLWREANALYGGTSRRPDAPRITEQWLKGEDGDAFKLRVKLERPASVCGPDGEEAFYPCWQVIGTAYVHGIMKGEVRDKYQKGEAALQTFLLV